MSLCYSNNAAGTFGAILIVAGLIGAAIAGEPITSSYGLLVTCPSIMSMNHDIDT